jgi:hypothetical protein
MRSGPDLTEERHEVCDVVVESKLSRRNRNIACIVPVGDVDVVIHEHGGDCASHQCREVPGQSGYDKHLRLGR